MEANKRKIVILIWGLLGLAFNSCAQNSLSLKDVDSLVHMKEANIKLRLKREVDIFLQKADASLLYDPIYFPFLNSYSTQIRDKLFECYIEKKGCSGTQYNRRVLGLLDLPKYMKDSLLNYSATEPEVRASAGDTVIQGLYIKAYQIFLSQNIATDIDLQNHFVDKKLALILLLYIRSNKSVKEYVNGMSSTGVYEDMNTPWDRKKNKVSIFATLLGYYSAYIGGSPLISDFYYDRFLYVTDQKYLGIAYQDYLSQLEKYFFVRHNIKIEIKAPYMVLGQEYFIEH
jgi:hypothetical protein